MQFALDKTNKLPYYDQIKHQLTAALHMGGLKHHHPLPTVRALARSLEINPKTALKIYHRLQEEGFVEVRVGSGVRVAAVERKNFEHNYFTSLVSMIERHMEEAHRLNFPPDKYLTLLHDIVDKKKLRAISCIVVECNTEQIQLFAKEISNHAGLTTVPVLINDLLSRGHRISSCLEEASFLVTTDYHWDEVKRVADQHQKTALKIRLKPEFLSTLVQCARKGGILMAVSNLDYFPNFRAALRDLGYQSLLHRIHAALASDERRIMAILPHVKYVYLSPLCDTKLLRRLPRDIHALEFAEHLSNESLLSIRTALLIHHLQQILPPAPAYSLSGPWKRHRAKIF